MSLQSGSRLGPYVSPDGQRFLVMSRADRGTPTPLTIVMNWR